MLVTSSLGSSPTIAASTMSSVAMTMLGPSVCRRDAASRSLRALRTAPNIVLKREDGREVHLRQLQGKIVLLDFWATWCTPCRASEPALNELSRRSFGKGFVLALICGDEDLGKWRRYVQNHHSGVLEALNKTPQRLKTFEVQNRLTFVLIDEWASFAGIKSAVRRTANLS